MKYNIGDVISIKHAGKIGIVTGDGYYDGTRNGYHITICGIPNGTYYYYEYEIEKLE